MWHEFLKCAGGGEPLREKNLPLTMMKRGRISRKKGRMRKKAIVSYYSIAKGPGGPFAASLAGLEPKKDQLVLRIGEGEGL